MRLLQRGGRPRPGATTIRPASTYLARAADEARRLAHGCVGTEHVLLALIRDPNGGAVRVLAQVAVTPDAVERSLTPWLRAGGPDAALDPAALAALGIDLEAVRSRLERSFGPGALESTRSACLAIAPRLKLALALAVDLAGGGPPLDEHVLLGMLTVRDSAASRALGTLGVTLETVQAAAAR
jgi:ATP-dependent Clp protease ATP-binding subunit ClpA